MRAISRSPPPPRRDCRRLGLPGLRTPTGDTHQGRDGLAQLPGEVPLVRLALPRRSVAKFRSGATSDIHSCTLSFRLRAAQATLSSRHFLFVYCGVAVRNGPIRAASTIRLSGTVTATSKSPQCPASLGLARARRHPRAFHQAHRPAAIRIDRRSCYSHRYEGVSV